MELWILLLACGAATYLWRGPGVLISAGINPRSEAFTWVSCVAYAIIAGVVRNGPADRAGIKPGDILLAVNGQDIPDTTVMLNLIAKLPPGRKAKMTVLRSNREATLDVSVGKRPRAR